MQFTEQELQVLKNFALIHPSMIIQSTVVKVINASKSCVGIYDFETPYNFPDFGIYEMQEFLSILSAFKAPSINVGEKKLVISEGTSKATYFTTEKSLLPVVKDANA